MNCGNCKHFHREDESEQVGDCKRYPPKAALDATGEIVCFYVSVEETDGCGEYFPG